MSYSLSDYCDMIKDSVRMNAYAKALKHAVTPDSIVLDMGCGTGIFCLLACQYGAKRVYGIDPNPAVDMAKKVAVANGYGDRIVYYDKMGKDVTLPEMANLMISDLRGALPVYGQHLDIVRDARKRLLTDDAVLIPQRDVLRVALASSPKAYKDAVMPWGDNDFGFDFGLITKALTNIWEQVTFEKTDTFSTPQIWSTLNYGGTLPTRFSNQHTWTCDSKATFHGVCLWFDCTLIDDIGYSCYPASDSAPRVYGHGFFPFSHPLDVKPGDTITVDLTAEEVSESYLFSWNTTHRCGGEETTFKQSTVTYQTFASKAFRRRGDDHVPKLSEEGDIVLAALTAFNEGCALGEVAKRLSTAFPKRFPTWQKAMGVVGDFSTSYGKRTD